MKKILIVLTVLSLFLVSCGNKNSTADIINPDAQFQYFFGATCPHCQELNKEVQAEDLFSKITVEKKEVYFNNANRDEFLAFTKKLGLTEKETGVPFVYDKVSGKHAVGVGPAMELFKSALTKTPQDTVSGTGEEQTKTSSGSDMTTISAETTNSGSEINEIRSDEIPLQAETLNN